MPAFSPSQQRVLLELARFAASQIETLRKRLASTSARALALEQLLVARQVVTSEELQRIVPEAASPSRLDDERDAAYREMLRRILAGDGTDDATEDAGAPHPRDRWYTSHHAWVKVEEFVGQEVGRFRVLGGQHVRLGITPAARRVLGDPWVLELPRVGARLLQGEAFVTFRSPGATRAIESPLSGEVVAVNEDLTERTYRLWHDPFGSGWLVIVAPIDRVDTTGLLPVDVYLASLTSKAT